MATELGLDRPEDGRQAERRSAKAYARPKRRSARDILDDPRYARLNKQCTRLRDQVLMLSRIPHRFKRRVRLARRARPDEVERAEVVWWLERVGLNEGVA